MFAKSLKNFPVLSQINEDPNVYQRFYNCGPTSTAMIYQYIFGKSVDPEWITSQVYGPNYTGDTGWNIDDWFWKDVCNTNFVETGSLSSMENLLKGSLKKGYAIKGLGWYYLNGQKMGHFRVCYGTYYKLKEHTQYYMLANPWTGETDYWPAMECFNMSQNQWLVVEGTPKVLKPKTNPETVALEKKFNEAYKLLYNKPHPSKGKGYNIEKNILRQLEKIKKGL